MNTWQVSNQSMTGFVPVNLGDVVDYAQASARAPRPHVVIALRVDAGGDPAGIAIISGHRNSGYNFIDVPYRELRDLRFMERAPTQPWRCPMPTAWPPAFLPLQGNNPEWFVTVVPGDVVEDTSTGRRMLVEGVRFAEKDRSQGWRLDGRMLDGGAKDWFLTSNPAMRCLTVGQGKPLWLQRHVTLVQHFARGVALEKLEESEPIDGEDWGVPSAHLPSIGVDGVMLDTVITGQCRAHGTPPGVVCQPCAEIDATFGGNTTP